MEKFLSNKCGDLTLISRNRVKDLDRVAFACNPRTGGAETGGSLGLPDSPPRIIGEFQGK